MSGRAGTSLRRRVSRALARSPIGWLARRQLLRPWKERLVFMGADDVLEVLDALDAAGIHTWLAGGWGVDALLGRQTRRHRDVDLVLDRDADAIPGALAALAALGISKVNAEATGGPWMPELVEVGDGAGRIVDLLPMDLDRLPAPAARTTGRLAGREVACLSAGAQASFHRGFRLARSQRRDARRLAERFGEPVPLQPPGAIGRLRRRGTRRLRDAGRRVLRRAPTLASVLLVPIPEAAGALELVRRRGAESVPPGVPSHVTLLFPFLAPDDIDEEVERSVADLVGGFPAFDFRLARVDRFPGVVYLAPEPAEPFIRLTDAIWSRWPDHPPYEGLYPAIIPHVTMADGKAGQDLVRALEELLPIEGSAREVWLMEQRDGGAWATRATFPLAGETSAGG